MTLGSLFSGIGGLDLGLERAGFEVRWQVESNKWCRQVLAKHWPNVERHERIEETGGNLQAVDCIAGGFPCQDISNAGARAGIDGDKSGLWREFARIVRDLRPRIVVVENVSALLARGLGRVLGDLAASGYDAQWDCIPASALGAPHQRDRIFVVAYAQRSWWRVQPERQPERGGAPEPGNDGTPRHVADAQGEGVGGLHLRQGRQPFGTSAQVPRSGVDGQVGDPDSVRPQEPRVFALPPGQQPSDSITDPGWWIVEPPLDRVAYGVSRRVDRLRGLGNAVVPQVAEFIGRRALEGMPR